MSREWFGSLPASIVFYLMSCNFTFAILLEIAWGRRYFQNKFGQMKLLWVFLGPRKVRERHGERVVFR